MGTVLFPTGKTVYVQEVNGTISLSELVNDMMSEEPTEGFRIYIIETLSKMGNAARDSLQCLKQLVNHPKKLLAEAARQAIPKIELGEKKTVFAGYNVDFNVPDNRPTHIPSTTPTIKRPDTHTVTFTPVEVTDDLHVGMKSFGRCNFCEKIILVDGIHRKFSDKLIDPNKFYCSFCVRNDYYQRFSSNIMVLTFRGLIGYYYYAYYVIPKTSVMHMTDVQDYVELHVKVGLHNPLFRYDPETYCWFIDFTKVGNGKKKVPLSYVLETIIEVLASFNLYENVRECSPAKLYAKYSAAISLFHETRERMNDERVFAPTLFGCDIPTVCKADQKALPVDILQGFIPSHMQDTNNFNRVGKRW